MRACGSKLKPRSYSWASEFAAGQNRRTRFVFQVGARKDWEANFLEGATRPWEVLRASR